MSTGAIEVLIVSLPDEERCVAELWHGKTHIAMVRDNEDMFEIELYASTTMQLDMLIDALDRAKKRLRG